MTLHSVIDVSHKFQHQRKTKNTGGKAYTGGE